MRPVEWDLVPARECNQNRLPSTRTSEKLQFQTKRLQMKLNAACSSSSLSESGKSSEHTKPVPVHAPCFCRVGKCVFSQNMFVGNGMSAIELHSSTRSKCAFTKRTTTWMHSQSTQLFFCHSLHNMSALPVQWSLYRHYLQKRWLNSVNLSSYMLKYVHQCCVYVCNHYKIHVIWYTY